MPGDLLRNRTVLLRIPTGLAPPDVRGHEYFRRANRTKMFHVKHFGTIAGAGFAIKITHLEFSGERETKLCARTGSLFR